MSDDEVIAAALEFAADSRIVDLWNGLDIFLTTTEVDIFRGRCREVLAARRQS